MSCATPANDGRGAGSQLTIAGDNAIGVVGDNNTIRVVQGALPPIAVVPVRPGVDHITEEQAARIKELVGIIAGSKQRSFGGVYGDLFRHLGGGHQLVTRYRLIPLEMYDKAVRYLEGLTAK